MKNSPELDFAARTDRLAELLRMNVTDVWSYIGISKALLMGCRSDSLTVSNKTWRKLEVAEERAKLQVVREDPARYVTGAAAREATAEEAGYWRDRAMLAEAQLDRLQKQLGEALAHLSQAKDAAKAAPLETKPTIYPGKRK